MSWKHYNTETKKIEGVRTLVGDMEQFGAIVMAEDTWNVILQVSERVPWSRQSRMNTFIDDLLFSLLEVSVLKRRIKASIHPDKNNEADA